MRSTVPMTSTECDRDSGSGIRTSRPVFHERAHFVRSDGSYRLLPFRFLDFDGKKLLVNEAGEHHFLDPPTFHRFVTHRLNANEASYGDLKSKHFLWDSRSRVPITLSATKYRTKHAFLEGFTRLHIFVLTLRCDHSCHYCQVSRVSPNRSKYDMTRESADRALDLVFQSPAEQIKIEFQGGEPLLNFELLRFVVEETRKRNAGSLHKDIQFVVATNLAFLTDEILDYLECEGILVSTSLDGPAFVHNANRPRPDHDSHALTIDGIRRVRERLGHDRVSAVMTTSRLTLQHPEAVVDEYVHQGFQQIFLRPISPYGFALRTKRKTGYDVGKFLSFYKRALDRIVEVNKSGYFLVEAYAQILLTKILTPFPTTYVDLQSPAGAGIGAVVYNYDGDVYASDEARMLAEMGDRRFRLGNVHRHSYRQIFGGEVLRRLVDGTVIESWPGCADCAFQPYCGADPFENLSTQGDMMGHRATNAFHKRNFEIIKHLLRLHYGDSSVRRVFWSWIRC